MRKTALWWMAGAVGLATAAARLHAEQPGLPPGAPDAQVADAPITPDVLALIAALDDEKFIERERATRRLQDAGVCSDATFVKAIETLDLSLEQRMRLLSLLRQRFDRGERAAIGLSFHPLVRRPCVGELRPKFPAAVDGVLRAGDVFLEVDGIVLDPVTMGDLHDDIIGLISSFDPGDRVPMKIFRPKDPPPAMRGAMAGNVPVQVARAAVRANEAVQELGDNLDEGQVLEVTVRMGRRSELERDPGAAQEAPASREKRLTTAWKYRLARMGVVHGTGEKIELSEPLAVTPLGLRNYNSANVRMTAGPVQVVEREGVRQFFAMDNDPVRVRPLQLMNAQVMQRARVQIFASDGNRIELDGGVPSSLVVPETPGTPEAGPPAVPDEVSAVMSRLERARLDLEDAERKARESQTPADRAAHEARAVSLRGDIARLDAELETLVADSAAGLSVE